MFALSTVFEEAQLTDRNTVCGICHETGAVRRVPVSALTAARFEARLEEVPANLSDWGGADLRALCDDLVVWDVAACERALSLLASHGSAEAFECIAELRPELSPELKEFAELAFATALNWLGFDYLREWDDTAPTVMACTPA